MKMLLIHGRESLEQDMEDWGYSGETLFNIDCVHFTYGEMIVWFKTLEACEIAQKQTGWTLGHSGSALIMQFEGDCLKTIEGFFGDYELQDDK